MAAPIKSKVLSLYKQLLKEGNKLTDYNFRLYAIRRTRDAFKENKNLNDASKIQILLKKGTEDLEMLKRQALLTQLFGSSKLVIESKAEQK